MGKRKVSNPLALAVLAVLSERSMHPYEMATMLKARGKERSIRLNYGSLYNVADALVGAGFIVAVETVREGRRPERTVYSLTEPGRTELTDWLSEILRVPSKEYPEFEAGLSLLLVLPPDKVAALLTERERLLLERVNEMRQFLDDLISKKLSRLYLIEADYECALLEAELTWVRGLTSEIKEGSLEDLEDWRNWHRTRVHEESMT